MRIGVPTEIKDGENRVAVTPAGVDLLVRQSAAHEVLVQAGAGEGSGITDEDYEQAGARLVDVEEVWGAAEMVIKVKEPLSAEYGRLRPDLILFTYLHLASSLELTRAVRDSGVTAVAYETVQTRDGNLPLLAPMSEVAGRLATQIGAHCLTAHEGGRGVLLGGVPGVPPADVVILGCGAVGLNAAKIALGMGAQVTIIDINPGRLKYLDDIVSGRAITWYSTPYNIARAVRYADLVIGAVLIPGARAPHLVTEDMVGSMHRGAVVLDVAVDQGGCIETIRPTSHSQPTYTLHGVVHYAVPNIPSAVPRTATFALTNATLPYVAKIADLGLDRAMEQDPSIAGGLNARGGEITYAAVLEAFGGEL
jgi:alanine dehydrogenase